MPLFVVFSGEPNAVGLLDMYGFESRSTNYLEQLIANAFNEQIQSFYNQSIFQWETVSRDTVVLQSVRLPVGNSE